MDRRTGNPPMTAPTRDLKSSGRRKLVVTVAVTATVVAILVTAALVLLVSNPLGGKTSLRADASADPSANAAACRAYDTAIEVLHTTLRDPKPVPFFIAAEARPAADRVSEAAKLAEGETRAAMERVAVRIQVLADKEEDRQRPGFDNLAELAGVRSASSAVGPLCATAGVYLRNA